MELARWQGKVALVTGASGGIGKATALALADAGMTVVACARSESKLHALNDQCDGEIIPRVVDLNDMAATESMFTFIRNQVGGVDVLVNNAGIGFNEPLLSGDTEKWRQTLNVNVLALCVCTREAVQDMRRRGDDGHVFHVSSMAGHRVPPASGLYSASKFAVRSLTEGLRQELRAVNSRIRITAISPGYVETGFAAHYHGKPEASEQTYGQFKCLQSEDIASSILYALGTPEHMAIHDILIRPTEQVS